MKTDLSIHLNSLKDTEKLAHTLAPLFSHSSNTVALSGTLGSGKTTFTKYLLAALSSSDQVSSPTYVLQHEYSTPHNLAIEHWDVYRLSSPPEELLTATPANTLRLIEWADKFPTLLVPCSFQLQFSYTPDHIGRLVSIIAHQDTQICDLCKKAGLSCQQYDKKQ